MLVVVRLDRPVALVWQHPMDDVDLARRDLSTLREQRLQHLPRLLPFSQRLRHRELARHYIGFQTLYRIHGWLNVQVSRLKLLTIQVQVWLRRDACGSDEK